MGAGRRVQEAQKYFVLTQTDNLWKEHLSAINFLQQAVSLRGYAQRDPLVECAPFPLPPGATTPPSCVSTSVHEVPRPAFCAPHLWPRKGNAVWAWGFLDRVHGADLLSGESKLGNRQTGWLADWRRPEHR